MYNARFARGAALVLPKKQNSGYSTVIIKTKKNLMALKLRCLIRINTITITSTKITLSN